MVLDTSTINQPMSRTSSLMAQPYSNIVNAIDASSAAPLDALAGL